MNVVTSETRQFQYVLVTPILVLGQTAQMRQPERYTASFPPRRTGSRHVGFVVDEVTLGQIFSEYLGFHCKFAFH
jgi:hypothetical protein